MRRCAVLWLFALLSATPVYADAPNAVHPTNPPQKMQPLVYEDDHGQQHALSDDRGAVIVLNIWATWCGPCVKEMPSLARLQSHFDPRHLKVIPLSEDRGDATVSVFYHNHGLTTLPVAVDNAGIAPSALHLHGLPTTLIINASGQEIARVEGDTIWDSPEMLAYLSAQTATTPIPPINTAKN